MQTLLIYFIFLGSLYFWILDPAVLPHGTQVRPKHLAYWFWHVGKRSHPATIVRAAAVKPHHALPLKHHPPANPDVSGLFLGSCCYGIHFDIISALGVLQTFHRQTSKVADVSQHDLLSQQTEALWSLVTDNCMDVFLWGTPLSGNHASWIFITRHCPDSYCYVWIQPPTFSPRCEKEHPPLVLRNLLGINPSVFGSGRLLKAAADIKNLLNNHSELTFPVW